jgi:antitoxin component of MazEF toxin-antitoxin module
MKTYTSTLKTDPETGELMLPIPSELLEDLGWKDGDTLICSFSDDQTITLRKKTNE